ncbi:hypothetical protein [Nocardia niwae]|uniref:hypothetical protein n=1 Tax=Nocardia niwae TaxID=626084 RepID=UPI000A476465|nr:hypothetical protein [Nocardia niwae]
MMATQTDERADSIEHLDHNPNCDGCGKPAKFWLGSHGCMEAFGCPACTEFTCDMCESDIRKVGTVLCRMCNKRFQRLPDFVRVEPL